MGIYDIVGDVKHKMFPKYSKSNSKPVFHFSSQARMVSLVALVALVCATLAGTASAGVAVYTNSLQPGWTDWSWPAGAANFGFTTNVHSGSSAIAVTVAQWQALSLHTTSPVIGSSYTAIRFVCPYHATYL